MQNVWSNNLKSVAIKKKRSKEILAMKNCVNLNIQILPRIYLVMLEKKSEKSRLNREEMVGEIQPPLIVFPNRDKEQFNSNVGSESSISLLKKMLFQCKTPISPGKVCVSNHKKSTRIHPLLRELWPLKEWSFF